MYIQQKNSQRAIGNNSGFGTPQTPENMRLTPDGAGFIHNDWELEFKTGTPGTDNAVAQLVKKDGSSKKPQFEYGKLKRMNIPGVWVSAAAGAKEVTYRPAGPAKVDYMTMEAMQGMTNAAANKKMMIIVGGSAGVLLLVVLLLKLKK